LFSLACAGMDLAAISAARSHERYFTVACAQSRE
jgi:hypothetical protein